MVNGGHPDVRYTNMGLLQDMAIDPDAVDDENKAIKATMGPHLVVDGDKHTFMESAYMHKPWWKVDLGNPHAKTLVGTIIAEGSSFAGKYPASRVLADEGDFLTKIWLSTDSSNWVWNFDKNCIKGPVNKPTIGACADRVANKHCSGEQIDPTKYEYKTYAAAKKGCLQFGSRCFGVYDNGCKLNSKYTLCDSRKVTKNNLRTSKAGSCVYVQPKKPSFTVDLGQSQQVGSFELRNTLNKGVTKQLQEIYTLATKGTCLAISPTYKEKDTSVLIHAGSSTSNTKTIKYTTLPAGKKLYCPERVDQLNWAQCDKHSDWFAVSVSGVGNATAVTVKRSDSGGGWTVDLQFICTVGSRWTCTLGQGSQFALGSTGVDNCHAGMSSVSESACAAAASEVITPGFTAKDTLQVGGWDDIPQGCSVRTSDWTPHWNKYVGAIPGEFAMVNKGKHIQYKGKPTVGDTAGSKGVCEGHCNSVKDCEAGLKCFKRGHVAKCEAHTHVILCMCNCFSSLCTSDLMLLGSFACARIICNWPLGGRLMTALCYAYTHTRSGRLGL